MTATPRPGAHLDADGRCRFTVWAPYAGRLAVRLEDEPARELALEPDADGYFHGTLEGVAPGCRYRLLLDGEALPDPASRWQPDGVHGPSAVADPAFAWSDAHWRGLPWSQYVIYELHLGTFSPTGDFDGAAAHLDELAELGVTAVELMPVAEFPGSRNWGYDGVFPFAAQSSYGGPEGLQRLVDACHARGLAVVLDVVYNHLGPEGNVLPRFGPYFTDRYRTPWGEAVNFDGPDSGAVRHYFIDNARYWIRDCHIDALRLDAVHAIHDMSAYPILEQLADTVAAEAEQLGRRVHLVAESDLNDPRLSQPAVVGGTGLRAQWNDEFHHAVHAHLTGERAGYYLDFGAPGQIAKALAGDFVYTGDYSPYRRCHHGTPRRQPAPPGLVTFAQNHDQVGNRPRGDRLAALADFETLKLVAGLVLLGPSTPLLFMGEEYGETRPFPYFVDHGDGELMQAVRDGRRRDLAGFGWDEEPLDPTDPTTFEAARLDPAAPRDARQHRLRAFHRELIARRGRLAATPAAVTQAGDGRALGLHYSDGAGATLVLFQLGAHAREIELPLAPGTWRRRLDSADGHWDGPGSRLPDSLESAGSATLALPGRSVSVWECDHPGGNAHA